MTDNGRPASFASGWTPVAAYHGLAPLVVLCFRHEDGKEASWYLDEKLERRGGSVVELHGELRQQLIVAPPPPPAARRARAGLLPAAGRHKARPARSLPGRVRCRHPLRRGGRA